MEYYKGKHTNLLINISIQDIIARYKKENRM